MKTIKIAGVPEHFNLPWHLAYEEGLFEDIGIELDFIDHPGGTGAMSQSLTEKKVDLALLLTEGAVKFISENKDYRIIKIYVDSPLLWGVHVPVNSNIDKANLDKAPFAISRYGSGSHLMAYVHAQNKGLDTGDLTFEIIKNLEGLRAGYKEGLDALFLWEKFTTKPYVDAQEMKRIDVCPTPWPCFVLVAHKDFISENKEDVSNLLDAINITAENFKDRDGIINEISERYDLKLEDVEEWIEDTVWNGTLSIKESTLTNVVDKLIDLKLIKEKIAPENLISELTDLK